MTTTTTTAHHDNEAIDIETAYDDDYSWVTHEMMLGAVEAVSGIPTGWVAQHDPSPRGLDWPALLEIWGPAALELLDQQQENGR